MQRIRSFPLREVAVRVPRRVTQYRENYDHAEQQRGETDRAQYHDQCCPNDHGGDVARNGEEAGGHCGIDVAVAIKQHRNRDRADHEHDGGDEPRTEDGPRQRVPHRRGRPGARHELVPALP